MNQQSCECGVKCPHGDRCMGGHAYYPDNHWYPCQKCSPARKLTVKEARAEIRRRLKKSKRR